MKVLDKDGNIVSHPCARFFFSTSQILPRSAYWNNPAAEVRRHYILCVLLAEGCCFRLLTHYYNGCYGNVSQTVDIIDNIVSCLVGDCQDFVISRMLSVVHPKPLWWQNPNAAFHRPFIKQFNDFKCRNHARRLPIQKNRIKFFGSIQK